MCLLIKHDASPRQAQLRTSHSFAESRRCPSSTHLIPPLKAHNYFTQFTSPPQLHTMASQLTLQTKVKLPSGHQIPQLGYGVSAV